jgi:hypothetical protein
VITTQYDAFGVHFSDVVNTAIFNDPPLAWGGVNNSGIVDLIAPVNGKIVLPGTGGTPGSTSSLSVEGGNAATGNLLLEVFDCDGNLIGSTINDDGIGPNGRKLMTLSIPGMSSFRVSTPAVDTFGVDSIALEEPVPCVIEVEIDIKPGSDPKSINCTNEKGVISVAILTTADFDALTVDHTTVTFEGATETHGGKKHQEDVDNDGDTDLVFHFRQGETSLDCTSTEGTLTGQTLGGQSIEGTDSVRMIDSGGGKL